jgi:hypothetical protein
VAHQLLSHPFRILPSGRAATVEQGSDEAHAEQLAVLLLTRRGERDLVPGFGVSDPVFAGFDPAEIAAGVSAYGPPVQIESIDVTPAGDGTVAVDIRFTS